MVRSGSSQVNQDGTLTSLGEARGSTGMDRYLIGPHFSFPCALTLSHESEYDFGVKKGGECRVRSLESLFACTRESGKRSRRLGTADVFVAVGASALDSNQQSPLVGSSLVQHQLLAIHGIQ